MAVIAVAGGTGKLGRAIVEALVAEGKHKALILSREVRGPRQQLTLVLSNLLLQTSETKEKEIGAPILAVNYNDINALTSVLETNKVEVVISAIEISSGAEPEFDLIQAADKSSMTRRYIPSVWGMKSMEQ
jgi:NAD(P)-dependent dehydrogenase (short-subunit alcohol dehydrogenase family)